MITNNLINDSRVLREPVPNQFRGGYNSLMHNVLYERSDIVNDAASFRVHHMLLIN